MLDLAHLERVWALWAFTDLKVYFVAFTKIVKICILKFVHVEKEILFLALDGDKSEALVCKTGDGSFLHVVVLFLANADVQSQ